MKKLLLLFVLSLGVAFADPAPLGLELGKATVKEAKSKYKLQADGINKYSLGPMFRMEGSQTGIEGLSEATLIFDEKSRLVAVILDFPKSYWDKVYPALKKKYKLVDSRIPFVGDKYAEFKDGASTIMLNAPHLSFTMSVLYARDEFLEAFYRIQEQEKRAKQRKLERGL